jgi:hypothetical protein
MWLPTVRGLITGLSAISERLRPLARSSRTSRSLGVTSRPPGPLAGGLGPLPFRDPETSRRTRAVKWLGSKGLTR